MAGKTGSESLWEFALALYRSPGVEETVLSLQDEREANVNILLWCFWLEYRGSLLTPAILDRAQSAITDWDRQVVRELRHLRRRLKSLAQEDVLAGEIRNLVKQAELLSERRCLYLLESLQLPASMQRPEWGRNAAVYLGSLGVQADLTALKEAMQGLIRA